MFQAEPWQRLDEKTACTAWAPDNKIHYVQYTSNVTAVNTPKLNRTNLQSCIKVTKLFVEFYFTVPTLQFWHRFLAFISCGVVSIRSDLVGNLFILWDGEGLSSALEVHLALIAFPDVYILCLDCKQTVGKVRKTICWTSPCSQRSDLLSQLVSCSWSYSAPC